jgi:hypothetical protein
MNAAEAQKYYWKEIVRSREIAKDIENDREKQEVRQVKYYTREGAGIWYGKGVALAGLPREVTEEHLGLMLEGKTLAGERMGARLNTTREVVVYKDGKVLLDPDIGEPATKDVANRRCGTDWTFSLDKASSCYLARTGDPVFRAIVHEALEEQLDAMEAQVQTQVHEKGKHFMRTTGNWLPMVTIHFTGRPVNGKEDPHWHAHCVVPNQTWDSVEGRWKAMEQGALYRNKARHQAEFHARVHTKALAAGYGLRRTEKGVELSCGVRRPILDSRKRRRGGPCFAMRHRFSATTTWNGCLRFAEITIVHCLFGVIRSSFTVSNEGIRSGT